MARSGSEVASTAASRWLESPSDQDMPLGEPASSALGQSPVLAPPSPKKRSRVSSSPLTKAGKARTKAAPKKANPATFLGKLHTQIEQVETMMQTLKLVPRSESVLIGVGHALGFFREHAVTLEHLMAAEAFVLNCCSGCGSVNECWCA